MRAMMRVTGEVLLASLLVLATVSVAQAQAPPSVSPPPSDVTVPRPGRAETFPLTEAQRVAIRDALRQDDAQRQAKTPANVPAGQPVTVGTQLPPSIALDFLPDRVLQQLPVTKTVQYALIRNQIVLVDPTNMRVVDVINK
jgi:hypothetical protein